MNLIKASLIFICMLICFVSVQIHADKTKPTKQELWSVMSENVNHWSDSIGYPIDQEVKETVIVLNLLKIITAASCEGHLDHGHAYPWIDLEITPDDALAMLNESADIYALLNKEIAFLQEKNPHLTYNQMFDLPEAENLRDLLAKRNHIQDSILKIQRKTVEPLNILLDEFYKKRNTSYDRMLVLTDYRLRCVGSDRQIIRSPEEKSLKMAEYLEEMKAFTDFLKQKFMNL